MTLAAKFEGFTDHRNGLRGEHGLELRIAQFDGQVVAERELDAVHALRVVLPASLYLGSAFYDEAERLVLTCAPFRANRRFAQIVLRSERADTWTHFELDRLTRVGCAQGDRAKQKGRERARAA